MSYARDDTVQVIGVGETGGAEENRQIIGIQRRPANSSAGGMESAQVV